MKIFIPGNVPSSKNSKRWTGKMLINSKTVMNYIKESKGYYLEYKNKFKKKTYDMLLTFATRISCENII